MILHNDTMANGLNPGSSHMQVNSLVNSRLKLPPIAANYNEKHNNRPLHGNGDLKTNEDFNLPRVNFNALELQNSATFTARNISLKGREDSAFSLPRVYTVLPPIGQKFVPSAPDTVNIPNAPNSVRHNKRSSRRPRVKKQPQDLHFEKVSNPETAVDNEALIKTSVVDSGKINSESICIDIPDSVNPTIDVNLVQSQDEPQPFDTVKLHSEKQNETKKIVGLGPNAIYATISDDAYSDNERGSETPFPQFSTIPEELKLYADVYPPSPPPEERKAKIAVEKTRQMLVEENSYRISFMGDVGHRRRNATCVELDDALKNAIQLLRDLFLRKTMEELCMLW